MSLNTTKVNNISVDGDDNFDEEDTETIIHNKLMVWSNDFNNAKHLKNK